MRFGKSMSVRSAAGGATRARLDAFCAKWPVATYFLFMAFPEEHMLLRPTFAQRAATAFSFDLRYRAEISWLTYARLLELSRTILREIIELEGRDMLDVQAFIWKLAR